ncbi:MAG: YkgJ family cysteine cluster protein [Spirochaetia bacterium]|nr:YkgJ family cysteine cluster protein [Spirochaetia bacterium]
MSKPFWADGLRFSCTRCSACCRQEPGLVLLSASDLVRLMRHTGLAFRVFLDKFTRSVDMGNGWSISLTEKPGYDCVFWDGGCTVYQARPVQCSTYPFWPGILDSERDWLSEAHECPGIGRGTVIDGAEIARRLEARMSNTPILLDYTFRWETVDEDTVLGRTGVLAHADHAGRT